MDCAELKITSCTVKSKGKIIQSSTKTDEKKEELQIKLSKKLLKEKFQLMWNFKVS